MYERHIPQRKCVVCGKITDKNELARISKSKDGEIELDLKKTKDGRGAYICKNNECPTLLIKKGGLNRSFRKKVEEKIQNRILEELINSGH